MFYFDRPVLHAYPDGGFDSLSLHKHAVGRSCIVFCLITQSQFLDFKRFSTYFYFSRKCFFGSVPPPSLFSMTFSEGHSNILQPCTKIINFDHGRYLLPWSRGHRLVRGLAMSDQWINRTFCDFWFIDPLTDFEIQPSSPPRAAFIFVFLLDEIFIHHDHIEMDSSIFFNILFFLCTWRAAFSSTRQFLQKQSSNQKL